MPETGSDVAGEMGAEWARKYLPRPQPPESQNEQMNVKRTQKGKGNGKMKAKRIDKNVKEFRPITIEIVIEKEAELADLWCRLNLSQDDVAGSNTDHSEIAARMDMDKGSATYDLWDILNDETERPGWGR